MARFKNPADSLMKFVTFKFPHDEQDKKRLKRLVKAYKEVLAEKISNDIANMKYLTIDKDRVDQKSGICAQIAWLFYRNCKGMGLNPGALIARIA